MSDNVSTITSSYVLVDTRLQDVVVELPAPTEVPGQVVNIKEVHSNNNVMISANTVPVDVPVIWLENNRLL